LAVCILARGEIIDRVAVAVDTQVITQSQLMDEIRVVAFQNGDKPDFSPASRRAAADRLVEQALIRREMQLTRFPEPKRADIEDTLKDLRSRSGSDAAYQTALREYGITQEQLEQALLRQSATLQFIELRFRPEVQVQEPEVMSYYEDVFVPEAQRRHIVPTPAFDAVREQCEEALTAQLVDKRVAAWLKEARSRVHLHYQEDAFQ
jgi:hypothetical protein